VRKTMSGLLRSSRPALVMAVLVAVVGVTGTAYAGKSHHHPSGGKKGDPTTTTTTTITTPTPTPVDTPAVTPVTSHGDNSDSSDKSDHTGWDGKSWKHHKGHKGHKSGNAPTPDYGVATVNVSRGGQPATAWATYSTALGSPVGDNTGGVFRFTCSTANAPCTVAVKGAILSDSPGTGQIYPRVLIYRQDYNAGGPEVYCEYGDGSTGSAPLTLTDQASSATPTYTAVPINIGLTADCGLAGPAGDVSQITVPSGYYDVHSTFVFLP
jgi:hypothetical protein